MKALVPLAIVATIIPLAAQAHDPVAKHGGRIVYAGHYHVELVAKGATVEAFLVDHNDKPIDTGRYKGLAILVVDGQSLRIPLAPAQGNRLRGEAPSTLPENPKGVVQITNPAGAATNAKFN